MSYLYHFTYESANVGTKYTSQAENLFHFPGETGILPNSGAYISRVQRRFAVRDVDTSEASIFSSCSIFSKIEVFIRIVLFKDQVPC